MKLLTDTRIGPRQPSRRTLVNWPELAKTTGRVWELKAPGDFKEGRARAIAESARSWARRHGVDVTARVVDESTVKVLFSE